MKIDLIKSVLWALFVISFALYFCSFGLSPFDEYKLLKAGVTTKGFVTNTSLDSEKDDGGKTHYSYTFDYYFHLPSGKKITSFGYGEGKPQMGFLNPSQPFPIKVIYLPKDSNINIIEDQLHDNIFDILRSRLLQILLLGFVITYTVHLIKNAINKFIVGRKANQASIIEWLESMKIPM